MSASRSDPSPVPPLLLVRDLAVSYGGAPVLQGVTVEVDTGSVAAVVGANGAGKTTLLRAISGVLGFHRGRIVGGSVEFAGQVLRPSSNGGAEAAGRVRRGIALVMEGGRVFPGLTVDENLRSGAPGRRHRERSDAARARVLDLFPALVPLGHTPAGRLSGGERQMLAIGRALMSSPRLLLLDEPFLGLAPKLVEQLQEFLRTVKVGGTAVVIAEQSAEAAFAVADRAFVLAEGTVAASGRAPDIARRDIGRLYLPGPRPSSTATASTATAADAAAVPQERVALLEVAGLSLRFGPVTALDGLTMQVAEAEIVAVIGPNGAGKTSVLNCVNQLYRPSAGSVRLAGTELTGLRPWEVARLGIARTFQQPALVAHLDVVGNLLVGRHRLMTGGLLGHALRLRRWRREESTHRCRCEEIVDLLGLGRFRGRPAGQLAHGIQKVVELGRALAMEARLILLDEPSAGMSPEETDQLARGILDLRAHRDVAVLMVEHRVGLVGRLADRVIVLDHGRLVAAGPTAGTLADPEVERVYLGRPAGPQPEAAR